MSNNSFIQRTLIGAADLLKNSLISQEHVSHKGFLQSLDPRIKVITFVLFILLALLLRSVVGVLILYLFTLLLASRSRVNIGFFLKRTWIFIPLFSFFTALPALFSIFSPGEIIFSFNFFGAILSITRQGLGAAVLFVLRVATCVSLIILLNLTTKLERLLKVLRLFKVSQVFVVTLGICHRYIFLFIQIIENTYLAIKSRVGTLMHYKSGQRVVAWNIASLWQRSYQLNQDVYSAMLSRGFCGEPALLDDFKTKTKDWLWLVFSLFLFIGAKFLFTT